MFIKEKVFPNKDNEHFKSLYTAKGDPPGNYTWTILVDGQYLDTGNFQLVSMGEKLIRVPSESEALGFMQKLKEIRMEERGLAEACMEMEWDEPLEYSELTERDAFFRADQFISRHQNTIYLWENCRNNFFAIFLKAPQFFEKLDLFVSNLSPPNEKFFSLMNLLRKHFRNDKEVLGQLMEQVIALQAEYVAYFKRLKQTGPVSEGNLALTFPDSVKKKEAQIYKTLEKHTKSVFEDLEAMYALIPSTLLGARRDNAKIQMSLLKAGSFLNNVDVNDENLESIFNETIKEIQMARFLTYQAMNNEKVLALKPQVKEHYEIILKDLRGWEEFIDTMIELNQVNLPTISEKQAALVYVLITQVTEQVMKHGENLDRQFKALEQLLSSN